MSSASEALRSRALSYLRYWLNSVFMHTLRGGEASSVYLVGTRKDRVGPQQHHELHVTISKAFEGCPFWPYVQENEQGEGPLGHEHLCFFPCWGEGIPPSSSSKRRWRRSSEGRLSSSGACPFGDSRPWTCCKSSGKTAGRF